MVFIAKSEAVDKKGNVKKGVKEIKDSRGYTRYVSDKTTLPKPKTAKAPKEAKPEKVKKETKPKKPKKEDKTTEENLTVEF